MLRKGRCRAGERPRTAVRPRDELLRFGIPDDALLRDVPLDPAAGPEGNVAKVAGDHGIVANLDIRARSLAGIHALEKVADVFQVHVAADPTAWLTAGPVHLLAVLRFCLGEHFPAAAVDDEHAVVAVEGDAVIALIRTQANCRRVLPQHREPVALP